MELFLKPHEKSGYSRRLNIWIINGRTAMLFNPGDRLQYRTFYATVIPFSPLHGYGFTEGPWVTVEWDPDRKKRPCVESSGTYSNNIFELAQPTQTKEERILSKIKALDLAFKNKTLNKKGFYPCGV
jgi:hypothetical protein